jgi:NTE family protein
MRALVLSGGGPLAVAWESGVLAGLAQAGVQAGEAEFILGTSAGAILGAQIAAGADPGALAQAVLDEANGVPPPGAMRFDPGAAAQLPGLFAKAHAGQAGRAEVGAHALAAAPEPAEAHVARMALAIGGADWTDKALGCVAVDAENGSIRVLTRDCGAPLAAAVAASACLPGFAAPVGIGGRLYIDGGFASTVNADLAAGYARVLVVVFRPPGPAGERIAARLEPQLAILRGAGADVRCVLPDAGSLEAIGPNTLDLRRRPAIARAGIAQGVAEGRAIHSFWNGRATS